MTTKNFQPLSNGAMLTKQSKEKKIVFADHENKFWGFPDYKNKVTRMQNVPHKTAALRISLLNRAPFDANRMERK